MSEETKTPDHPAHPRATLPRPPHRWPRRVAAWLLELSTVFIGVYAAFFLSYRASQRQAWQRREQLLTWVDQYYSGVLDNARSEAPKLRKVPEDFRSRAAAGEMPAVSPSHWRSDYDASDSLSVLQSGGYDLLAVETVRDLRDVEGTLRPLVAAIARTQRLSDTLILPNLGGGPAVFYDPSTRQLRESYAWYVEAFDDEAEFFEELQPKIAKLLEQVRAERRRGQ